MDIPITLQLGATTQVVALVAVAGPVRTSYHCMLSGEAIAISMKRSLFLFNGESECDYLFPLP